MTDWIGIAQTLHDHRVQAIKEATPKMEVGIADSPTTAPGYRYLGCVYFTTPHPFYPVDPAAVRAFKEFCPDYVPLWCRWFFQEQAGDSASSREIHFDRHIIGRRIKDPRLSHTRLFGAWGSEAKGWAANRPYKAQLIGPEPEEGWPNYLEGHWHYTRDKSLPHPDMPGDFAPHGDEMVDFFRSQMVRPAVGETLDHYWWRRHVDAPTERAEARKLAQEEEGAKKDAERRRYEQSQMDKAGESDWARQVVERMIKKRNVVFNLGNGQRKEVRLPLPVIPGLISERDAR